MIKIILYIFLVFNILQANFIQTPKEAMGRPFIQNYSYMDYKGDNQVWGGVQAKNGLLYFVNSEFGILEYDGVNWKHIKFTNNSSGRSIDISKDGTIFVGGVGDIGYLKTVNGETKFISIKKNIPKKYRNFEYVWETVATDNGVYFGTNNIIYRWHNNKITIIENKNGFHITRKVNGIGYTRIYENEGLMRLDKDKLTLIPDGEKFKDISMNGLINYNKNNILILSRDKGIFIFDGKKLKPFKTDADKFLLKNKIYDGKKINRNLFVIATKQAGVIGIDRKGKIKFFLNKKIGLRDNLVTGLFVDKNKDLWITSDNGISKVEIPSSLSRYGTFSGIKASINDIIKYNGSLYLSTMTGIYKENSNPKNEKEIFKKLKGITTNCWEMVNINDNLIVGTNDGLYKIDKNKLIKIDVDLKDITNLIVSKNNSNILYLSTKDGISIVKLKDNKFELITKNIGIDFQPWSLAITNNGILWGTSEIGDVFNVDFSKGLKAPVIKIFGKNSGLKGGKYFISSIDNKILISTTKGIFKKDNHKFILDSRFKNTKENAKLIEDNHHNIWIRHGATQVITVAKKSLDNDQLNFKKIPFRRFSGYKFKAIYIENNGVAWFGGPEGLIKYTPRIEDISEHKTLIREVIFNNKIVFGKYNSVNDRSDDIISKYKEKSAIFNYGDNSIKFSYAMPYFVKEKTNQYQVRLEGYNNEWLDWTTTPFINYTNLSEGDYKFYVRGKNIYEDLTNEDVFIFTILPPWYRTWWAYLIYGLIALLIIYLAVSWQVRKVRKEAEKELKKQEEQKIILEKLVAERTEELRESFVVLEEKSDKINNLLNNAGQGFLSFEGKLRVDGEYSKECFNIFDKDIASRVFPELLILDDRSKQKFLTKTLKDLLKEKDINKRNLILGLLQKEFIINDKNIKVEYKLIGDEKMMVVLTDITEQRLLERQMEEEKKNLKMVVKAVVDKDDLLEIIQDYNKFYSEKLPKLIYETDDELKTLISETYRAIHTFKGLFSQVELVNIIEELHNLESEIGKLKDNLTDENTITDLQDIIEKRDMETWLDKDLSTLKEILGDNFFEHKSSISIEPERVIEIENIVSKILGDDKDKNKVIKEIKSLTYKSFGDLLKGYNKLIERLSDRLEKPINPLIINGDEVFINPTIYSDFTKSLVHIFRNSMEHGIENMDDRYNADKDEYATIKCTIKKQDNGILLTISDDGSGIDVNKLRDTLEIDGIDKMTDKQVISLIWDDGISTNNEISDLSGRGIGLPAVKGEVEKLGGKVLVKSKKGKGTVFYFSLPIKIV